MRIATFLYAALLRSSASAASLPDAHVYNTSETRISARTAPGWQDWQQIDSGMTPNLKLHPLSKIAAVWNADNTRIDLFATDYNGVVHMGVFEYGCGWRAWWPIVDDAQFAVGASVTAIWRGRTNLNLFVTAADGSVWSAYRDAGSVDWVAFFPIHEEYKFAPGAKVTALARDAGHLDLFVTDNNGVVWSTYWDSQDGAGWHLWTSIDPSFKVDGATRVAALWKGTTRIDLAVVTKAGYVFTNWFEYGKGWQRWRGDLPGKPLMMLGTSPTVVWAGSQHLSILCIGNDGSLYSANSLEGTSARWRTVFNANGSPLPRFVADTEVSLFQAYNGRWLYNSFAVDDHGQIVSFRIATADSGWNGYSHAPQINNLDRGRAVTALETDYLHFDLFVTTRDGKVWNTWYNEKS